MNPNDFQVHDVTDFPLVRLMPEGLPEGYAVRWEAEMEALIRQPDPFVMVVAALRGEHREAHEDRKRRTLWMKRNRDTLARRCRGMVAVEPDTRKRAMMRAQSAALAGLFKVPLRIVATAEEADAQARAFLGGTGDG
ncbi:GntR family transcriptional regulator [Alcanivorax marinus]|uniref:GntR family transcriptional regulator n=1 Tax=Alloalcanivorax marinus TaxID=1177169 RepID=A0A9Q3UPC5_9GAMM|nr:GntR family transcriptional regulator [Alloalcanivorax marinus]MCC4309641.1 GntR family transcriptional regulator [Alloalcanivorax marinus]